jgi:hypothetical protein
MILWTTSLTSSNCSVAKIIWLLLILHAQSGARTTPLAIIGRRKTRLPDARMGRSLRSTKSASDFTTSALERIRCCGAAARRAQHSDASKYCQTNQRCRRTTRDLDLA